MSKNLHPIIIRSGITSLWNTNTKITKNYSNYYLKIRGIYLFLATCLELYYILLIEINIRNSYFLGKQKLLGHIFNMTRPGFGFSFRIKNFFLRLVKLRNWNFFIAKNLMSNVKRWIKKKKWLYYKDDFQIFLKKEIYYNIYGKLKDYIEHRNLFRKQKRRYYYITFEFLKPQNYMKFIFHYRERFGYNLSRILKYYHDSHWRIDVTHTLLKLIIYEFQKNKKHWPVINAIKKAFLIGVRQTKKMFDGFHIHFVGKIRGARRSRLIGFNVKKLAIPYQTFNNYIFRAENVARTVYGTVGISMSYYISELRKIKYGLNK